MNWMYGSRRSLVLYVVVFALILGGLTGISRICAQGIAQEKDKKEEKKDDKKDDKKDEKKRPNAEVRPQD